MKSRTKNSIRNIGSGIACKIVMMFFPFVIRNIIIRQMGADYAGLNTLFNSLLNFLALTELGFGSTIIYMMYEPVAKADYVSLSALLNLFKKIYIVIGGIILGVGTILTPFLYFFIKGNVPVGINVYIVYYINLINVSISYFMFGYRSSLFAAFQRTDIQSKIMMYCYFVTSMLQIMVLLLFNNFYVYILFNPVYTILQNLFFYKKSVIYFPEVNCYGEVDKKTKKDIFIKTIALAGHKVGGTIIGSLDNIVISMLLGLEILGRYSNYYMIISALMALIGAYMNAILPSIGNYIVEREEFEQHLLFKKLSFLHSWIVGWSSVCLLVFYQQFIELWVGKEMLLSYIDMLWMVAYFYFWQFRVLACNFKDASGLWTEDIVKPFVASILDVILNVIFVTKWGVKGALISTVICMICIFFPFETFVLYKKLFKTNCIRYVLAEVVWTLEWCIIAGFMILISRAIEKTKCNYYITLIPICLILPNILFLLINYCNKEYRLNIKSVVRSLKIEIFRFRR